MKVFFFVQDISRGSGGLRASVYGLANGLYKKGLKIEIFTSDILVEENDVENNFIKINKINYLKSLNIFNEKNRNLIKVFSKSPPDLIHIHGLWKPITLIGFIFARIFNIKYVISPHGMLMSYAIEQKKIKKLLALNLYQREIFNKASLIITASKNESKAINLFNNKLFYKEIPHGIFFPTQFKKGELKVTKSALFLARLNPTKGIKELIETWIKLDPINWNLIVAGIPEDYKFLNDLKSLVPLKMNKRIIFYGPAFGSQKENLLKNSDLFILPTKTENFGISILEAMAYKIPVITTKEAPWALIRDYDLGWWIENSEVELFNSLLEATSMQLSELRKKGDKAQSIIKTKFSWQNIAQEYINTYKKVTN